MWKIHSQVDFWAGDRVAGEFGIGTIISIDEKTKIATIQVDTAWGGGEIQVPTKELFSIAEHKFYVRKYNDQMFRIYKWPDIILGAITQLKGNKKRLDAVQRAALSSNIKEAITKVKDEFAKLRAKIEGGTSLNVEKSDSNDTPGSVS